MNVKTKSVDAAITPVESENPNGEFEVVLSTEALDRDGERLYINEWQQPLPKRIQIDGDHARSIEKTVGSVVPRIEGNRLVGKGSYAPTFYAQEIRKIASDKYAEGHALSLSVTFSEHKNQKDGGIRRELLNAGMVAIPANVEAVILSSKAAKIAEGLIPPSEAREQFDLSDKADGGLSASGDNPQVPKHDDMIQAIHDAACHLGAQCLNEIDADPGTADGANKSVTGFEWDGQPVHRIIEKSSAPEGGSPQESADEDAAAAAKAAAAVDKSAEDTAKAKAAEIKARALAFLISQNSSKD